MLYAKPPEATRFHPMNMNEGVVVINKLYATIFNESQAETMREDIPQLKKMNVGWEFELRSIEKKQQSKKPKSVNEKNHRELHVIAWEIQKDWGDKVKYSAKPYLSAMKQIRSIDDDYHYDSAASIVRYFLSNATGWRGQKAREIKAELKGMLK
jgi:hypothetical protein